MSFSVGLSGPTCSMGVGDIDDLGNQHLQSVLRASVVVEPRSRAGPEQGANIGYHA